MVTGATGLLGSHLLCHLARCGETIIALKRDKSHVEETMALFSCYFDSPGDAISRVNWVVGNVLDGESVAPFVEKVDTVYHCAARWFLSMAAIGILCWKRISRGRKIFVRFVWNVGYACVS